MDLMDHSSDFLSLFVRVNGVKTHFYAAGEGEPLVLVHGGAVGTNALTWKRNIAALSQHYRVYALDRIGFGLTEKPRISYTYEVLVRHLADFIDALCLEQVYLTGHSMGAYGVAKYAVDHPERVKKCVLVSSGSTCDAMGIDYDSEGLRALREATLDPSYENVKFLQETIFHQKEGLEEQIREKMYLAGLEGTLEVQRSLAGFRQQIKRDPNLRQRHSLRYRLPELTIPILLIWGMRDRFSPYEYGLQLKEMLPNLSGFHAFENSGHAVMYDESERFNQTVLQFLSE